MRPLTSSQDKELRSFCSRLVISVLVPDIHLQSALVQTSLLQASVDQPAHVYCINKERTRPVTSSLRSWSRDSPTGNFFYILLLRSSQVTSTVIPVPLSWTRPLLSVVGLWMSRILRICLFKYNNKTQEVTNWSRDTPTSIFCGAVSKNNSKGVPHQLSDQHN